MKSINILSIYFNKDIYLLIKYHYYVSIIQNFYRNNRPITNLNIGDRVYYSTNKKLIYCTIVSIKLNSIIVKKLPEIIPNWKISNINFWNNINNENFPYYIPPKITIHKCKIFKLNDWKINNIDFIDNNLRLEIYNKLQIFH